MTVDTPTPGDNPRRNQPEAPIPPSASQQPQAGRTTRMTVGDALVWIGFFIFQGAAWLPRYSENGTTHPAASSAERVIGRVAMLLLVLVVMASLLFGVWLRALKRWEAPKAASWWWLVAVGYAVLVIGLAFARVPPFTSDSTEPIGFAIGIYVAIAGVVIVASGVVMRILRPAPISAFNNAWLRWPFLGVSIVVQALLAFVAIIVLLWAVPGSLSSPPTECKPPRCTIAEPISSP